MMSFFSLLKSTDSSLVVTTCPWKFEIVITADPGNGRAPLRSHLL